MTENTPKLNFDITKTGSQKLLNALVEMSDEWNKKTEGEKTVDFYLSSERPLAREYIKIMDLVNEWKNS